MPAVLFVCLGNICRSPLAEEVFRHLTRHHRAGEPLVIDSAGTGAWHQGEAPDPRSLAIAARHGIDISRQRARQVVGADFSRFDLILAMDGSNLSDLRRMAPSGATATLRLFLDTPPQDVPDPYYGGPSGFEAVFRLVEGGARRVAAELGVAV
ncbi:low molecular weight protein-tyrosine-phosphatase [Pannonibacter tanglangensis]|uniref:protein-tyrosine-phosphatase n=1 Tax=Pannonibacter tanglangensis TaxID=2750084 RepID=A0ABW9ZKX4_9HYPH|nr:low molecular weight protein-tyrosine-phosphatase [Pannonibacter sp. XCT-34]NBN65486.1 low molecular weight phosphotyrosine protein phosphatase [Pannonibacter sp. XCT-34]